MDEIVEALNQKYAHCTQRDREGIVGHIEGLLERFLGMGLQDEDFLSEIVSEDENTFHQRYWELFLGCWLDDCGYRPTSGQTGPDFRIESEGKVIWLEAICPGPGDGDNLIPQPEMRDLGDGVVGAVYSVPHEQTLLRWTGAIANKTSKFQRYLDQGIIEENDSCIIAVNGSLLGSSPFTGISQMPFVVEATCGVGPLQITLNRETGEHVDTSYSFRPVVKTVNGIPVDCDVFLDSQNQTPQISGILGTVKNPGSCVGELEWQIVLVKNSFCTNPLPEDLKISNEVYSAQKEGVATYKLDFKTVELE